MANQLHEVTLERQSVVKISEAQKRLIVDLENSLQNDAKRNEMVVTAARLSEISVKLESQSEVAREGENLRRRVVKAEVQLSKLRQNQKALSGLRSTNIGFANRLNLEAPSNSQHISETMTSYLSEVESRLTNHQRLLSDRIQLKDLEKLLKTADEKLVHLTVESVRQKTKFKKIDTAWAKAEKTRESGKVLSDKAVEVRTNIVRRVFNDSLNAVWKDLFIRLAPDEQFIPAFSVPEFEKGPVVAQLETIFRGKNIKGNPRSMLSAGNLNTAALTLFLSLHLSVKPQLPWLVIDDPVQSMDEIHIVQFAALLRTLSRQQNRQTIIAVHERPLFEYLALELSPAFKGDRLVTVELSRSFDHKTEYSYEMKTWNPNSVLKVSTTS